MKKYIEPEMEILTLCNKEIKTGSDGNIIINPWGGYDSTEETNILGKH